MPEATDIPVKKMPRSKEWAILVAMQTSVFAFRPDYTKVEAPALAFYAVTANQHYPSHWLPEGADADVCAKAEAWWKEKGHALMREPVEIVELHDAIHYVFTGDTADEVAAKIRKFLLR
jgi:hypothetical protein